MAQLPSCSSPSFGLLRNSATGKSIAEYGLILALVVLIAIPALSVLSDNMANFYGNEPVSRARDLFALLSGNGPGGGSSISGGGPQVSGGRVSGNGSVAGVGLSFNSDGTYNIQLPPEASRATQNTSVEGQLTGYLAIQLAALADGTNPDGTPLDNETRQLLQAMSDTAHRLASEEDAYVSSLDPSRGSTPGDPNSPANNVFTQLSVFHELNGHLEQHLAATNNQALLDGVRNPIGMVSHVGVNNFVQPLIAEHGDNTIHLSSFHLDSDDFTRATSAVGEPPAVQVSLDQSGTVTHVAADQINEADQPASGSP